MFLFVCIIVYFFVIVSLLKQKKLSLRYTLLWLFMGVICLVIVLLPDILEILKELLGVKDAMNTLFGCLICFVFIHLISLTSIVSRQSEKIKRLIQDNALLEKRIRDMEKSE